MHILEAESLDVFATVAALGTGDELLDGQNIIVRRA
jgi:hypothetical protein